MSARCGGKVRCERSHNQVPDKDRPKGIVRTGERALTLFALTYVKPH